jgi:hypothetical protein
MSEASPASPALFLLDGLEDFKTQAIKLAAQARRRIVIFSRDLDAQVFAQAELVNALSTLARTHRQCEVFILLKKNTQKLDTSHALLRLSQRLSSKIHVRELTLEPDNTDMSYMLVDTTCVLYQNDDRNYKGFANYEAAPEVKRLLETFNYLWEYGEPIAELQVLHL